MNRISYHILGFFSLSVFCLLIAGCSDGKPRRIPVSGTVTFQNLETPETGTLYFVPITTETSGLKRPAFAVFDRSGKYAVTSFGKDKRDGLLPGKYKVYAEAFEKVPTLEEPTPKSFVPAKYSDPEQTPFTLDVPAGSGKITKDFVIEK